MSELSPHIRPPGTVLGSYRIVELLGEGGMAHVYLAEHMRLGRRVALKLLFPELAERHDIAQRFFAEARAVNAIRSEHIVDITDFVEDSSDKYFVMELLEGPSLREVMEAGSLHLDRILDVALQLARTLEIVHATGILHRDLKPDNVMLVERGGRRDWVKLLDFGIAKFMDVEAFEASGLAIDTNDGAVLGTPAYLAPELLQGVEPDFRADVYSFGLVVYQMVTGKRPFASKSLPELIYKQMNEAAPRLADFDDAHFPVPERLDSLVRRCLEKTRDLRPPSMSHVVAELETLYEELGLPLDGGGASFDDRTAGRTADHLDASLPFGARLHHQKTTVLAAVGAAVLVLCASLAIVGGGDDEPTLPLAPLDVLTASAAAPPSPRPDPRILLIEEGGASSVLAALDEAGERSWSAVDQLVRGHALFALGKTDDAWRAYNAAVGERTVDERLLERALAVLQRRDADVAMDVLASWPDERATSALRGLLDDEGWWPRHHALKILDDRSESTPLEHASVALLDLDTGPKCGARRYGLTKLTEHGNSSKALAALDRAATRKDNGCLKKGLKKARAAITARTRESAEPPQSGE